MGSSPEAPGQQDVIMGSVERYFELWRSTMAGESSVVTPLPWTEQSADAQMVWTLAYGSVVTLSAQTTQAVRLTRS